MHLIAKSVSADTNITSFTQRNAHIFTRKANCSEICIQWI